MPPIVRNVLAVIAGLIVGSLVNMGLIILGSAVVPPPAGVDVMDPESIKASMHLFGAQHFVFPFLAHALGTLVGAFVAALIGVSRKVTLALIVGGFFLAGGVLNAFMLPAPTWFLALDLIVAYIPMAWLGGKLGERLTAR